MHLTEKTFYDFGPFTLDAAERVLRAGGELRLSPRALELLEHLVSNPGRLVSRDHLKQYVWQALHVSDNSIDQKIAELRRVFSEVDPTGEYIQTRHGLGWRFIAPVIARVEPNAPAEAESPPVSRPDARGGVNWRWQYFVMLGAAILGLGAVVMRVEGVLTPEPQIRQYRQLTHDGLPKALLGRAFTDGRQVFFYERPSVGSAIAMMAVPSNGGEAVPMSLPIPGARLLDRAAVTGDWLIRDSSNSVYLWRARDHSLEATGIVVDDADISADSSALAFGVTGQVTIQELGPRPNPRTVRVPGGPGFLRWSPDGSRLRFSLGTPVGDQTQMWEVRRDGSHLTRLPIGAHEHAAFEPGGWTSDGRYFFYTEIHHDEHSSLWVVPDAPGRISSGPVRLTNDLVDFGSPAISPDGSTIYAIGSRFRNELVKFDAAREDFIPIWQGFAAVDLSFSKDARWAASVHYDDHTLWVSRADGCERRQITWPPLEVRQP